jgi:DNA-binding NtrC family response regulator
MAAHVLIVDDDPADCRHVEEIIRHHGHSVESAPSGEAALARLTRAGGPPISAMILDLVMPDLDGMAVLERLSRRPVAVPVIVQTAPGGIDAGAAAMRAGAFDFLVKPATPERVRVSLANALRIGALEGEVLRMRLDRSGALGLSDIILHSSSMERVHRLAERAARSPIPVLIEGERGVGKELFARAIHGSSARRTRPFVAVSCGDLSGDAIEVALFGARNGGSAGRDMLEASGGTLFLDEIGALPPDLQERLARLLAEQGADGSAARRPQRADVRLIAATSRRLIDLVCEDAFDEQLFHRLNILPIWIPPLRERRADIPDLARSFLARLASEAGRSFVTGISAAALDLLAADAWPGNLCELQHAIFRAVMLCEGSELTLHEFPLLAVRKQNDDCGVRRPAANFVQTMEPNDSVAVQEQVYGERATVPAPLADIRVPARYGVTRLLDDRGELRPIEVLEEEVIRFALDHYSGRMSEVARRLGIGRSTLYRKVRGYGIASSEPVLP